MASQANTTRRSLFAIAGAAGAAIALPAPALATPTLETDAAQFLAWEQERDAYYLNGEHDDASDDDTDYWSSRAGEVELLIHETPGHSRTAMLVKARQLRIRRQYDLDPHGVEAVDQIIAYLSGAHSSAALAAPARDPWDALISALATLHPELPQLAAQAREQGYATSELRIVMIPPSGERPYLEFYRDFLPESLRRAGGH